jgi:restriction modification system DNA specificity domain protein
MSKLNDLIKELCPDGVEYKPLDSFATIVRGNGLQKKDFTEDGVGCIHYGQIYTYYGTYAYETKSKVSVELAKTLKKVETGDLVVAVTSENIEDVCKCVAWLGEETIVTGGHAAIIKHKQNSKYLAYYFQTEDFYKQKVKIVTGTKVMDIAPSKMGKIIIPIPPLPVQCEIVRILDNFTALTSALTAELTAQRKRYSGLLNSLLSFEGRGAQDGVLWGKLGDIATEIYRGAGIKRDEVTEKGIQCVRYGEIYTSYNIWFDTCISHTIENKIASKKYFEKGDILFAITGESVEEIAKSCAYVGDEKCLAGGDIVVMKHKQNPKYLAYALATTNAQMQKSKGKVKSKVVHSSVPAIKEIVIPIPSLEEQQRIVDILDRFDKLCNDLSEGLPAEIAARQKQYEYYRDKLLTFKEKKA